MLPRCQACDDCLWWMTWDQLSHRGAFWAFREESHAGYSLLGSDPLPQIQVVQIRIGGKSCDLSFSAFFFFFLLITLRRKHQICVWLGKWEFGGFQLQCDCSPSAVPPYWRGYDGVRAGAAGQCSSTAETASSRGRSWNTTPRLLTLLLSVSHIFSPLLLTLPLFYLRF